MPEARVLDRFASFYPALKPGAWYPLSERGVELTRPEGATRSGGGPVNAEGVWLRVDGEDRFVFRQHLEWR
ncbi:MAG TPA: hypothetical protein VFV33_03960 [Gemmatimonadaceae bacterium]|nr:hypothetical protein [Gemmatimonadaceae bacterium]